MENNQFKYIVYCTTCTVNKKIYIGVHKTINPDIFDNYIGNGIYINCPSTYEHCKTYYQSAVKKYGVHNFIRNTIKVFDNENDAFLLEEDIVNMEFLKRTDVYNTSLGGRRANIPELAYTTYQYDDKGNFIKEYYSIKEAALSNNRSFRSIWRAINDKCKCSNCFWTIIKYNQLDLSKMKQYEGLHKIPVFQYSEDGIYDCCYESISDAARVLKTHSANISRAIKLNELCNNKYFLTQYAPTYSIAKSDVITSSKIYQYSLDGSFIREYKNMQEAKNILGIKANIYKAIKLRQTCGNYQWSFDKLDNMPPVQSKAGKARKVGKYDKDWNLITTYASLAECMRDNGASSGHVIRGRNEFSKGFRYKYLDD